MAELNAIHGLKGQVTVTRARMWRLAVLRAWWPFALFAAIFLGSALAGLFERLAPDTAAGLSLLALIAMALLALRSARRFDAPGRDDAMARLDAQSDLRPVSALSDRPARPTREGQALWKAHSERLVAAAQDLRAPGFHSAWRRADPAFLRFIFPAALIGLFVTAGPAGPGRLQRAITPDIGALAGAHEMAIEAWITPPEHTGRAPVFLETDLDSLRVPVGSKAVVRAFSRTAPKLKLAGEGGTASERFARTADGAFEARVTLSQDTRLSVHWWGERAAWNVRASPDAPPVVAFATLPEITRTDRMRFDWTASDDYGIETLDVRVWLREPHPAAPDADDRLPVDIVGLDRRAADDTTEIDTTRHRWAGLAVNVQLVATDASGQEGVSETVAFTLPEKLLLQPIARAAQEARVTVLREPRDYGERLTNREALQADAINPTSSQRLNSAPPGVQRASLLIDALTYEPERYFRDRSVYLGLRMAHAVLETAADKPQAASVEPILWAVALKAEYGSAADALRALLAARKALEQALRDGAPEDEIRRLMEAFKQAANNYIAAKMAEAIANGLPEAPDQSDMAEQGGGSGLGGQDFEDMLKALEELAETGASDQARQLLSDITNMLENLEFQQGGSGKGGFPGLPGGDGGDEDAEDQPQQERELADALERLSDLLRQQRELNDDTLAEQRGATPQRPGEGQMPGGEAMPPGFPGPPGAGLGDRQRELSDETGRLAEGEGPGGGETGSDEATNGQDGGEAANGDENTARGFGALGEGDRDRLEAIARLQERAARELERGNFGLAQRQQEESAKALRDLSAELAGALDELQQARRGEASPDDPFGRPIGGPGSGENVTIPDQAERQRAKDILEELRRRYDEAEDADERDYLQRLLDRF